MNRPPGQDRVACAALTSIAEPADPVLGTLLQHLPPAAVLAAIRSGALPVSATALLDRAQAAGLRAALAQWRARLACLPPDAGLARHAANRIRLVCPGDSGWPAQLDDLGTARPYALWLRGPANLAEVTTRSTAVIGSRAATAYGTHVCTELTTGLAAAGWTILSGAAYGIDAAAHQAALAAGGITLAVLACGPDVAFPLRHDSMLEAITGCGAIVRESPPGTRVSRQRLLLRNWILTALAAGTVVVEAARHSGTLAAARHAEQLARPLMAVPGPLTSALSAGCHDLLRSRRAICVTSASEVSATVSQAPAPS